VSKDTCCNQPQYLDSATDRRSSRGSCPWTCEWHRGGSCDRVFGCVLRGDVSYCTGWSTYI